MAAQAYAGQSVIAKTPFMLIHFILANSHNAAGAGRKSWSKHAVHAAAATSADADTSNGSE